MSACRQRSCARQPLPDGIRCADHRADHVIRQMMPLPLPAVPEQPADGWRDQAACNGMDLDLFYPVPNSPRDRSGHMATAALAACVACPVRGDCLSVALHTPRTLDSGIWAATSERQRISLRLNLRITPTWPVADLPPCLTELEDTA